MDSNCLYTPRTSHHMYNHTHSSMTEIKPYFAALCHWVYHLPWFIQHIGQAFWGTSAPHSWAHLANFCFPRLCHPHLSYKHYLLSLPFHSHPCFAAFARLLAETQRTDHSTSSIFYGSSIPMRCMVLSCAGRIILVVSTESGQHLMTYDILLWTRWSSRSWYPLQIQEYLLMQKWLHPSWLLWGNFTCSIVRWLLALTNGTEHLDSIESTTIYIDERANWLWQWNL